MIVGILPSWVRALRGQGLCGLPPLYPGLEHPCRHVRRPTLRVGDRGRIGTRALLCSRLLFPQVSSRWTAEAPGARGRRHRHRGPEPGPGIPAGSCLGLLADTVKVSRVGCREAPPPSMGVLPWQPLGCCPLECSSKVVLLGGGSRCAPDSPPGVHCWVQHLPSPPALPTPGGSPLAQTLLLIDTLCGEACKA